MKLSTEIKAMEVIDSKACVLGKVEDMAINEETLKIDYFIVFLDKEKMERFNIKKKIFGASKKITILAHEVSSIGDKVLLNKSIAEILDMVEEKESLEDFK